MKEQWNIFADCNLDDKKVPKLHGSEFLYLLLHAKFLQNDFQE